MEHRAFLYSAALLPSPEIYLHSRRVAHLCTGLPEEKQALLPDTQCTPVCCFLSPHWPENTTPVKQTVLVFEHESCHFIFIPLLFSRSNPGGLWCWLTALQILCIWSQLQSRHMHALRNTIQAVKCHTWKAAHCCVPSFLAFRLFKCLLHYHDSTITAHFNIHGFQIFYHQWLRWIN